MSPKNGKAGAVVSPADPKLPDEADKANPGEVEKIKAEQRQTQSGKYGSRQLKPNKPPETDEERAQKNSWIEIELTDEDDKPVSGMAYRILLEGGETIAEGTLNEKGFARVAGIEPGTCKVTFPNLDKKTWSRK